ncbi:MAG: glycosyltransferase family 1 protein [Rhodospirillales bacterium]|nr:glycosyltransferase family 1 protein [Rhodospirillales bacterium]
MPKDKDALEEAVTSTVAMPVRKLIFLCTEDWYFWSHRMPIARAARDAGFQVLVLTRIQAHGQRIEAEGFDVRPLPWRRKGDGLKGALRSLYAIYSIYRAEQPQLVHHIALKAIVFGTVAAFFARVPRQINAIAGLGFLFVAPSLRASLQKSIVLMTMRLFARRRGSFILTQNPDDAQELVDRGAARPQQVAVIRGSGVDISRFRPSAEPAGPIVVAMVSRMLRYKGVEILAHAAHLLRRRGLNVRFLLIGPLDPDSPAALLDSEMQRLIEPGVIEWLGATEDVPAVWRTSHISAFPTQYREGVPLALLEAAASGRPIVCTDTPGCREVVQDGVNGILVPQNDARKLAEAIERLALDENLRQSMGEEGRRRVERFFAKELIVRQTLDLYKAALATIP